MIVHFSAAARIELREAVEFYERQQRGLANRFLAEVETAVERIADRPETWARVSGRVRRCLVHRFPFAIFFHVDGTEIEILAVVDLRRDPTRWDDLA